MTDRPDLSTLTIAITGGARGIGLATADRLARAGARVVIADRDLEVAEKAAADLGVEVRRLDVGDPDSWRSFAADVGQVDVLVNNAGIMPVGEVVDEPDAVTRAILDVNLLGVITGTKTFAPQMIQRGAGHIVNLASGVGRVAVPGGATYAASKFGVVGFTEATRAELAPHGVDVSMVLPTVVQTELAAGVSQARFVKPVTAEDVAEVIEAVIRKPAAETWVPRWTQGMVRTTQLLPRRVQEGISRVFHADAILQGADHTARAAYEERVRRCGG
ncbi:MAG: SDR family oxidoreductase [Nocardioides sp.]